MVALLRACLADDVLVAIGGPAAMVVQHSGGQARAGTKSKVGANNIRDPPQPSVRGLELRSRHCLQETPFQKYVSEHGKPHSAEPGAAELYQHCQLCA